MSNGSDSGVELPLPDGAVGEDLSGGSAAGDGWDSPRCVELKVVVSGEEAATGSVAVEGGSGGARVCGNVEEPRVLKLEGEGNGFGNSCEGENPVSYSVSGMIENTDGRDSRNEKLEDQSVRTEMVDHSSNLSDYSSFLSAFDEFAARAKGEAVGHGYYIGDMVWGKVKSHPWWPGQIYNEALASPSVRRSKHEGQVLVAFFGDSSYGWFDPAELIPFEENFAEKSRQTTSRAFLNAVEEGVDEVSRRRSLGFACRCRNDFNFRPSGVDGYFVVDVGDHEPGVYGWNQIEKARDSFQPREMVLFVEQLAMQPLNHHFWEINFIKNKATVLACRKTRFEECDETYAQAFGTANVRPSCLSVPAPVDPAKAPLSGRMVIAEALGQGRLSVKPGKTKDQLEKDKYLFKRRDEPMQTKSNKAILGQVGQSSHLLPNDGFSFSDKVVHFSPRDHMHQSSGFTTTYNQHQSKTQKVSITCDIKNSEGFIRLAEGGKKNTKVQKRPAGELNAENTAIVVRKKQTKEIKAETFRQFSLPISNRGTEVENASGTPRHVPPVNTKLDNQKSGAAVGSFPFRSQQELDFGNLELRMMVTDLRALALNPVHGLDRSCPAVIRQVFLKYRSLVFQKSLALSPLAERELSERKPKKSLAHAFTVGPTDKSAKKKIVKPLIRRDDPTRGVKKLGPYDHQEDAKKKTLDVPEDVNKKKLNLAEETKKKKTKKAIDDFEVVTKKKKIDDPRLLSAERNIIQRSIVSQRLDTKESASKTASAAPPKAVKPELSCRTESATKSAPTAQPKPVKLQSSSRKEHTAQVPTPTMLVMKFPAGAALPSGAELRAKFARFGQMDHSATRVFWKTYTCRLVFLYKVDAQAALNFAGGCSNLFGNTNVRCYIREREAEAEAAEPELSKIQKEDMPLVAGPVPVPVTTAQPRATAVEQRTTQLKSSMKKLSGDEGGNGNNRGARPKFILGRDESIKSTELSTIENKTRITSLNQMQSSSSSKILANIVPPSTCAQPEPRPGPFDIPSLGVTPVTDVSQQMVRLLVKCNDVVNNLTSILGYKPYQPL